MMKKSIFLLSLLSILLFPTFAQEDFDAMFESEIITEPSSTEEGNFAKDLLIQESVTVGGRYNFSLSLDTTMDQIKENITAETFVIDSALNTSLYIDARPDESFRFFAKADSVYDEESGLSIELKEIFGDFVLYDTLFLRTGKQTINWGLGYFFSPANYMNVSHINPLDPEAEQIGPTAIKLHLPLDTTNLYTYIILGDSQTGLHSVKDIAIAPKLELVFGAYEVSIGGKWQLEKQWFSSAGLTGSIGDISLFGEAVYTGNSPKIYLKEDSTSPLGYITEEDNANKVLATAGFSYSYSTDNELFNVGLTAQYYFNGLGYKDSTILSENLFAAYSLINSGLMSYSDISERSQHYGALNLRLSNILNSDFSPSSTWIGNLEDSSGLIMATLAYSGIEGLSISVSYSYNYGEAGSEYNPSESEEKISLTISGLSAQF